MFNKNKKKDSKSSALKVLGIFVLIFNILVSFFMFFFRPRRCIEFIKGEKKEIVELSTGKESLGRFFSDSGKLAKDLFIPHEGNDHRPKVLRTKSLVSYVVIALVIKISVTSFLFFTYPNDAQLAAIVADRMVSLTNQARIEAGVKPLEVNPYLIQAATAKGQDMLDRQYFAHDTPDGKRPWEFIDRSNYDYIFAGENLAMDFTSAELVQAAFMKSPTHKRNIINPKYEEIGVAVLHGELDGRETILLVNFFGAQRFDSVNRVAQNEQTQQVQQQPASVVEVKEEPIEQLPSTQRPVVAGQEVVQAPFAPAQTPQAPLPEGLIVVASEKNSSGTLIDAVIEYSNIFFLAFLIFILACLILNIAVRFRVQKSGLILQTIAVLALILSMFIVKFHFVEQVAPQLLIL